MLIQYSSLNSIIFNLLTMLWLNHNSHPYEVLRLMASVKHIAQCKAGSLSMLGRHKDFEPSVWHKIPLAMLAIYILFQIKGKAKQQS